MTEDEFIEAMATTFAPGLPRMAGRMLAWLLICDPPERTAAEIAERLHASRGSISGMARLLEPSGAIRRRTRPGDRREYFSVPEEMSANLFRARQPLITAGRQLAERGLELIADRPPRTRERLQDLHDMYAFFEREWPALIDRFETEQATRKERRDGSRHPDREADEVLRVASRHRRG